MPAKCMRSVRAAGAPVQLQVMMEGESLFNDATAIVLFQGGSAVLVACTPCTPCTHDAPNNATAIVLLQRASAVLVACTTRTHDASRNSACMPRQGVYTVQLELALILIINNMQCRGNYDILHAI